MKKTTRVNIYSYDEKGNAHQVTQDIELPDELFIMVGKNGDVSMEVIPHKVDDPPPPVDNTHGIIRDYTHKQPWEMF